MHWIAVGMSVLLILFGWYGVYDATVHGNPGSDSMSLAGAFGGIATMIAGCAVGILARVIQAAEYHGKLPSL